VTSSDPELLAEHFDDKILALKRGPLVVVFNFHPSRSAVDYGLAVEPGTYRLVLDTDEPRFGGQGRLAADQQYFTHPADQGDGQVHRLQFYLPCRSALVMEKV